MSDLAFRLRAEAQAVPNTADPGLPARVRDHLPAILPVRQPVSFPIRLAVAAALIAALGLAWLQVTVDVDVDAPPVAIMPPAPPTLSEMLRDAGAELPGGAVDGELSALGADLAAVARTVRCAVPF